LDHAQTVNISEFAWLSCIPKVLRQDTLAGQVSTTIARQVYINILTLLTAPHLMETKLPLDTHCTSLHYLN